MRLDVDPRGNAWGVNDQNDIYQFVGGKWRRMGRKALDLGIGGDGTVWVIDSHDYRADAGGGSVWKIDRRTRRWVNGNGRLQRISVDPQGKFYGAQVSQQIWRDASAISSSGGNTIGPPPPKAKK